MSRVLRLSTTVGCILFVFLAVVYCGVEANQVLADLTTGEEITVNQCPMPQQKTKPSPEAKLVLYRIYF